MDRGEGWSVKYIEIGLKVSVIITKIETFYQSCGSEMCGRKVELISLFKITKKGGKMLSKYAD